MNYTLTIDDFTKTIEYIIKYPIWEKEKKESEIENNKLVYTSKIIFMPFNYVTEQDKEDVKQCLITNLIEILGRIEKTGFIDKKHRYNVKYIKKQDAIKLVSKFLRNSGRYEIYKILKIIDGKRYFISIEEEEEKQIEKYKSIFEDKNQTVKNMITKIFINDTVKDFIKYRDKLDTILFFNIFMELGFSTNILKDARKTVKGQRKLISLRNSDIAYMCNVSLRSVQNRKKKLIADFKTVYEQEIKAFL